MRFWRTLIIYAVIGPPIGWFVYAAGLIVADGKTFRLGEDLRFVLVSIPLSYVIGLVPAALAGLAVALIASPEIRPGAATVTAIGLVCGVLFAYLFGGGSLSDSADIGLFALKVLTCLVPSLICWAIARRWA